jgi:hypothetical protein
MKSSVATIAVAACILLLPIRLLAQPTGAPMAALRVTDNPVEIVQREAALAASARAAGSRARPGSIFTPAVAADVRAIVAADFARRSVSDRADLMTEMPTTLPRINEPYPTGEPLATFPPLLLQALPRLPGELEYRFMGRHLIIRDGRTNLIVDYLADVTTAADARQ